MPRFLTVSPTHIPGKKKITWERFRDGGYVAIGFKIGDMTGVSPGEVADVIAEHGHENEKEANAIDCFRKFLSLEPGDIVAVNNTNHGLFGIGVVTRGYHYEYQRHDTESEDRDQWYSHLVEVDWRVTSYMRRRDLVREGEKMWAPYGTVGALLDQVPDYIRRALGQGLTPPLSPPAPAEIVAPDHLRDVVNAIETLRKDPQHQERAHESLVESFLVALGFERHKDIRYRQGRIDITLYAEGRPVVVFEVKRSWELNADNRDVIRQAYNYSMEQGIRFVVITNGDYYLIMDRLKGLSYENNIVGEFTLSSLEEDSLELIESLEPDRIGVSDVQQIFKRLSESF